MQALSGIKIIDLTTALNGPFCTTLLGDHGAEIIKLEPPGGEQCRQWGPLDAATGESYFFAFLNRNKKGCTLNLKTAKGRALFYQLISSADGLVENFRPGVTAKLGIDYSTLRGINPHLIYASGSGFGQTGPLSHRACYDIVAQAMGGIVNITGFPEGPPVKVGPSIADHVAGIYLTVGFLLALHYRDKTGAGQHIDIAMLDTVFSILENSIVKTTMAGEIPQRQGNIDPSIAPFDIYPTLDGYIALGVGNDKLFAKFCLTIDKPELLADPLYTTNDLRCKNYTKGLKQIITAWTVNHTKAEVEAILEMEGIPCGPVLNMAEAIYHPQIQAREMMVHSTHPLLGEMHFQGCPVKMNLTPPQIKTPAPLLGQNTQEIFHLSDRAYKTLVAEGVF